MLRHSAHVSDFTRAGLPGLVKLAGLPKDPDRVSTATRTRLERR